MTRVTRPAYGENTGVMNSSLKAIFPVAIFSSRNPCRATVARAMCCIWDVSTRTMLVSASLTAGPGAWMSGTLFVLPWSEATIAWRIGSAIMIPTASRAPKMPQVRACQTYSLRGGCTTGAARGTGSAVVGCSGVAVLLVCSVIVGTIHLQHVARLSSGIAYCTLPSIATSHPLWRCHHHSHTADEGSETWVGKSGYSLRESVFYGVSHARPYLRKCTL